LQRFSQWLAVVRHRYDTFIDQYMHRSDSGEEIFQNIVEVGGLGSRLKPRGGFIYVSPIISCHTPLKASTFMNCNAG